MGDLNNDQIKLIVREAMAEQLACPETQRSLEKIVVDIVQTDSFLELLEQRIKRMFVVYIGRSVVEKLSWVIGIAALGFIFWLQKHGFFEWAIQNGFIS